MRIHLCVAVMLCAACVWAEPTFIYTNNNGSVNSVSAFSVSASGVLAPVSGSPFPTGGSGALSYSAASQITTTTTKNLLYVANLGSNTISGFSIDTGTGVLAPLSGSPFPNGFDTPLNPVRFGLAITPDDRFLFVTNSSGSQIAVLAIAANGALDPIPGSPFTTPLQFITSGTASPKVTPDGKFLAVASVTNIQGGVVTMFNVSSTGELTPASMFGSAGEARGIDCNCASNHLYAGAGTQGNAGAGYHSRIDAFNISSSGVLSPVAGAPFSGPDTNALNVLLSPDDSRLFVSSQFSNGITVFSVAPDGTLAVVPGSPFAAAAAYIGSMATNQAGTFLYAAQVAGNAISAFSIAANGALTAIPGSPFGTGASGASPLSLTAYPPKFCGAPLISGVSAAPDALWPPNGRLVQVAVDYSVSPAGAGACALSVAGDDSADESDWDVIDAHYVLLRAKRTGPGRGRVYAITITCRNGASGPASSRTVTVRVPHSQGR